MKYINLYLYICLNLLQRKTFQNTLMTIQMTFFCIFVSFHECIANVLKSFESIKTYYRHMENINCWHCIESYERKQIKIMTPWLI
jgi:hypothetical protein